MAGNIEGSNRHMQDNDSTRCSGPRRARGQSRTDVLPVLQTIFLDLRNLGPVRETIDQFIAMRRLSGRPVVVHHTPIPTD
jgi:hypothetical protein